MALPRVDLSQWLMFGEEVFIAWYQWPGGVVGPSSRLMLGLVPMPAEKRF